MIMFQHGIKERTYPEGTLGQILFNMECLFSHRRLPSPSEPTSKTSHPYVFKRDKTTQINRDCPYPFVNNITKRQYGEWVDQAKKIAHEFIPPFICEDPDNDDDYSPRSSKLTNSSFHFIILKILT